MRNRRELLIMTACAAASRSLAATPGRIRRIGWLTAQLAASLSPYLDALREGLVEQKLVPGESIEILYRYGDDRMERVPALARELVESGVELLIVQGAAIPDVLKLGLPVPIIFVTSADPISAGFAKSLSQPSGNCTGVTFMAFELLGKRLELLKEIIPKLNRVAVLGNPRHAGLAARADLARLRPDAISLLPDGFAIAHRKAIMAVANEERIPVISGWPVFAQAGALCTYGPRLSLIYRRVAFFVARILAGAKPGDLPVERPTQFELILNQTAARSFNLAFSRAILARADEVIE